MKTKTDVALKISAVVGAFAFVLVAALYQVLLDSYPPEIKGPVLLVALICLAGIPGGYYLLAGGKKENEEFIGNEQVSYEIVVPEPQRNGPSHLVEKEIVLQVMPTASFEKLTENKELSQTQNSESRPDSRWTLDNPVKPISERYTFEDRLPVLAKTAERASIQDEFVHPPETYIHSDGDLLANMDNRIAPPWRNKESLQKDSEILKGFIDNTVLFAVAIGAEGNIAMVSPFMLQSLGYTVDEVIGKQFLATFVPERLREQVWSDLLTSRAEDSKSWKIESYLLAKDGRKVPGEWNVTQIFDAADQLSYCFIIGANFTQSKDEEDEIADSALSYKACYEKAAADLEYYFSILESSVSPIAIYDMKGKLTYTNPSFTSVFGWVTEELQKDQDLFVPESQKIIEKPIIERLLQGGAPCVDLETMRYSNYGRQIPTKLDASLFHSKKGDPEGMLVVLREITETKKVEKGPVLKVSPPQKKRIRAKDVANDITSGLSDTQLMEKYQLTSRGLQSVFQKLLQANVLTPSEIYGRLATYCETIALELGRDPSEDFRGTTQRIFPGEIPAKTQADNIEKETMKPSRIAVSENKHPHTSVIIRSTETDRKLLSDSQPREAATLNSDLSRNQVSVLTSIYDRNDLLDERTLIGCTEHTLVRKRRVRAKKMAKDVHEGVGDTELMEKYNLSAKQLEEVLKRLLEASLITDMQLYERTTLSDIPILKASVKTGNPVEELN